MDGSFRTWIYFSFLYLHFSTDVVKGIPHEIQNDSPDGMWTTWSFWTACSRTCGAGVTSRTRYCKEGENVVDSRNCFGGRTEFTICNKQACPAGATGFRKVQCAVYNEIDRYGVMHQWLPVIEDECSLVCKMEHKTTTERYGAVVDGTRCKKGICIQGMCMRMGCDERLGSELVTDACGVCGGFNTTCGKFAGTFTIDVHTEELFNYYDVVMFPVGAFNISVQDHSDVNYLAMAVNDVPRLNPQWHIDRPGLYNVAGATFIYDRNRLGHERLYASGPIKQPVQIMLAVREDKPKVYYEFNIPTEEEWRRFQQEHLLSQIYSTTSPNNIEDMFLRTYSPNNFIPRIPSATPSPQNSRKNGKGKIDVMTDNNVDIPPQPSGPRDQRPTQKPRKKKKPKTPSRKELRAKCGSCKKINGKIKSFCYSDFVLHVEVVDRTIVNNMTRYDVRIIETFRNTIALFAREFIWVPNICNCPLIKPNHHYLIMGNRVQIISTRENLLVVGDQNMVRKWKARMRDPWDKLQASANSKCWKFTKKKKKMNSL